MFNIFTASTALEEEEHETRRQREKCLRVAFDVAPVNNCLVSEIEVI